MELTCTLNLEFDDEATASAIAGAVKIDDGDFVETVVDNNMVRATVKADKIPSLLHTLEDYLACINVAINSLK